MTNIDLNVNVNTMIFKICQWQFNLKDGDIDIIIIHSFINEIAY